MLFRRPKSLTQNNQIRIYKIHGISPDAALPKILDTFAPLSPMRKEALGARESSGFCNNRVTRKSFQAAYENGATSERECLSSNHVAKTNPFPTTAKQPGRRAAPSNPPRHTPARAVTRTFKKSKAPSLSLESERCGGLDIQK
jgi:hypothetical protein